MVGGAWSVRLRGTVDLVWVGLWAAVVDIERVVAWAVALVVGH